MREKANELKIAIRQYKNMRVKNCAKLVEKSSVSQGETSSSNPGIMLTEINET